MILGIRKNNVANDRDAPFRRLRGFAVRVSEQRARDRDRGFADIIFRAGIGGDRVDDFAGLGVNHQGIIA